MLAHQCEIRPNLNDIRQPWGLLPGLLASFVVDIHHHLFGTLTKVCMYMLYVIVA